MKSKKRHQSSEDDSEDSEASERSSSSESESGESSESEHRHRKKKKRADSSDSDSESDDYRRSKKRKHKKKKKKHVKRKRRSDSVADSRSDDENSSVSDGEAPKKKHKKSNKQKRSRSSSASVIEIVERKDRRLHSVVNDRRRSPEVDERPARTYYQKEYRSEPQGGDFDRQRVREMQRFYRGSSNERRYQEQYQYEERDRNQRYGPYKQEVEYSKRNTFHQGPQFTVPSEGYLSGQRDCQYQRNPRYEGHGRPPPPEEQHYQRKPRDDAFNSREQRGYNNRYNQYEERGGFKRNIEDNRDNRERERRGPPEPDRYRDREVPERRERHREEPFQSDRPRDVRRDKPPARIERPPPTQSEEDRFKERKRPEVKEERAPERARRDERSNSGREERGNNVREERGNNEREERSNNGREERGNNVREERGNNGREERGNGREKDERQGREGRREPRREDRRPERERERTEVKTEPRGKDRKSRFAESEGDKEYSWGKTEVKKEGSKDGEKEKPNFGLSGKLTADANTVNGVVIKYSEPDDAKQPKRRWRFYPFKGDKPLPILYIHRQSAFLIGRDKKVVDIMLEHPSISKQHAALQYRATPFTRPDGSQGRRVRPYVIDLESANGTFVNNKKIDPRRYVELLEKDVVKFGFSAREYVLLHENSKDDAQDDDNQEGIGVNVTTTDKIKQEKRIKEETAEDGE